MACLRPDLGEGFPSAGLTPRTTFVGPSMCRCANWLTPCMWESLQDELATRASKSKQYLDHLRLERPCPERS